MIFGLFYGGYIAVVPWFFGWRTAFWYALSLPPTSLIAYYYLRRVGRLAGGVRHLVVLLRTPLAPRRLIALRAELIQEIEAVRSEIRQPIA